MHYCLMLFTQDFPKKDDIENIMSKYNDNVVYSDDEEKEIEYPQIMYDWYQIGGRYNGSVKLRVDKDNEVYRWKFYEMNPRNGRLFWSRLLSDMQENKTRFYNEEDYFRSMGYNEGFLYVDGAKISDVINLEQIECYAFIGFDGEAYARSWWNGNDFIPNNDFDERLKAEKEKSKDGYVTIIDYHD